MASASVMKNILFVFLTFMCIHTFGQNVDTVIDERDGHIYKTVQIADMWIMAENLAYIPAEGNYMYLENSEKRGEEYGVMYDWNTAKNCAIEGWHLPTKLELLKLYSYCGNDGGEAFKMLAEGGKTKLNMKNGGGFFNTSDFVLDETRFWTSTPCGPDIAWCFFVSNEEAGLCNDLSSCYMYVRLIKNHN